MGNDSGGAGGRLGGERSGGFFVTSHMSFYWTLQNAISIFCQDNFSKNRNCIPQSPSPIEGSRYMSYRSVQGHNYRL